MAEKWSKSRIVFEIVKGLTIIILFIWLINSRLTDAEFKERGLTEDLNRKFAGRIDSIYRNEQNHNAMVVVINGKKNYHLDPKWENLLQKGDYLIKQQGHYFIDLHKQNGKIIWLDYRECYK